MSDNNEQFEKLSFWQLLSKTSVEIPIIQRDYAQGRENQQKVRDNFLDTLYNALTGESVELDFVYGSEDEKSKTLQPLDGQQRLTTLFLLHWYIATKEKKLDDLNKHLEINDEKKGKIQRRFSYETRTSSREFCNELMKNSIDFDNLLAADTDEKDQSKNNELSKTIKNSAWFVASWEKDPTISAMLRMLDAIHLKFKDTSELWEKLINEQNPPITFLYVKLENFGLSDDLYIKMNARGKQLTAFENFKSQFEKHIEINKFEEDVANPEGKFAHKIDTIWTDLFWQYKEKQDDNSYSIDTKLINFIAGTAINYYAETLEIAENKKAIENVRKELYDKGKIKNITDDAIKKERVEQRIQQLASNSTEITHEDFWKKEIFQYLIKCFNKYAEKNNDKIKTFKTKLWDTYDNDFLFKDIISDKPTQQKRVLFYAQAEYLLKHNNFCQNEFDNWIRVVRNIVENAISGSWNTELMINLIQLVHKWAYHSNDIYSFLSKENPDNYTVAKEQIKEEIEKAKIIIVNQNNKQVINETEDTNFCKGKIDFALYCIDYNSSNISTFIADKLKQIKDVFVEHMDGDDLSNDFRRALFATNDNNFYDYWWSWLYVVDANKYCIIESTNDLKLNFTKKNNRSKYLRDLVIKLCTKTIDEIIKEFVKTQEFTSLPNWKQRIINEKELLGDNHFHYIAIAPDDSCCWLMPSKRVANSSEGKKKLKEIK
ncbi:MAG: DUF262 domain-containing protein [Treponema sp.]|jgi:hypothetical protein|nr:DUF262 domain-containing protein [Treponema sp.]